MILAVGKIKRYIAYTHAQTFFKKKQLEHICLSVVRKEEKTGPPGPVQLFMIWKLISLSSGLSMSTPSRKGVTTVTGCRECVVVRVLMCVCVRVFGRRDVWGDGMGWGVLWQSSDSRLIQIPLKDKEPVWQAFQHLWNRRGVLCGRVEGNPFGISSDLKWSYSSWKQTPSRGKAPQRNISILQTIHKQKCKCAWAGKHCGSWLPYSAIVQRWMAKGFYAQSLSRFPNEKCVYLWPGLFLMNK